MLVVGPMGSGKTSIADFVAEISQSLTKPVYEPTVAVRYGGVAACLSAASGCNRQLRGLWVDGASGGQVPGWQPRVVPRHECCPQL